MQIFDLTGKLALVTGCSTGIGQAMVQGLAAAGADIIGLSTSGLMPETAALVAKAGRGFYPYACDLSNRTSLYAFLEAVWQNHPVIDIVVNNAGTIMRAPAAEHSDAYWDHVMAVNLDAQFILGKSFGSKMLQQGFGKIIFTCSLLSFQGGIYVPGYTASKAGVAGLVKAFCNEWAAGGVQVNGIAPGYIATKNTEALRNNAARNQSILERIPAGRWGTPDDLIGATVFLASPASNYVNGTILTVDGGWMAR